MGDPALDFVGLLVALGPDAAQQLIRAYGRAISWRRLLFYWWLNPCYELVYAAPHLADATAARNIDTIRCRFSELATLQDHIRERGSCQ